MGEVCPLSALVNAYLTSFTSRVFDRFSNAEREVCGNIPFCRIFSFIILGIMKIFYLKHELKLNPSVGGYVKIPK